MTVRGWHYCGMPGGASEHFGQYHGVGPYTGHKSVEMVRRYMRDANLFGDNPATKAGL